MARPTCQALVVRGRMKLILPQPTVCLWFRNDTLTHCQMNIIRDIFEVFVCVCLCNCSYQFQCELICISVCGHYICMCVCV